MTRFRWYDPEYGPMEAGDATNQEVVADRVEFAPGHVVFRDLEHRVILAVRNSRVDDLRQVRERGEMGLCGFRDLRHPGKVCQWPPHPPGTVHSWQIRFQGN